MVENADHENIVLLVIDTLRAKNLPFYGYEKDTAPFLSEMAEKGVKLEKFYSTSPWTVPAHASLFTGELPSEHGSTTQSIYFSGQNELVEALSQQGYNTYGISENELLNPNLGFGPSFDNFYPTPVLSDAKTWNEVWRKDGLYDNRKNKWLDFGKKTVLRGDLDSVKSFARHLDRKFLKSEDYNPQGSWHSVRKAGQLLSREEKSFVFLNLMTVHKNYTFNEEQREIFLSDISEEKINEITDFDSLPNYLEQGGYSPEKLELLENAYDASIRYTDKLIKILVQNAPKDTLFVIIGDHGELFGEYEWGGIPLIDHHYGTYKELIQVPGIIYSKRRNIGNNISDKLLDHRDILEVICDLDAFEGNEDKMVMSEYFGRWGLNEQFDRDIEVPQEFIELEERKSFSIISEEFKYDLTSDGEYLWSSGMTEEDSLEQNPPSELVSKANVLYRWRLE